MAASKQPDFWERGPSFADHVQGLHNQFGTQGQIPVEPYDYAVGVDATGPGIQGKVYDKLSRVGGMYPQDDVMAWQVSGALPEDAKYHVLDSLDLAKGSGAGQSIYPTVYGMIRNDPEAYNMVEGLSSVNKTRRNHLQSAALLRDPELSRRLLISPSQLESTVGGPESKVPARLAAWQRQSPEEQVGALQLMAAANMVEQMGRSSSAGDLERMLADPYNASALQKLMRGWGALPPSLPHPTRTGMEPKLPFGVRTAKRLGITQGVLEDRGPAPAAYMRSLEYRDGGSVGV